MYRPWWSILIALGLTSGGASTTDTQPSVVLPFWAGPKVHERYPGAVIKEHGLCSGDVAEVPVSTMPPESNDALRPEKVLEVDLTGHVIRRWRMPIDTIVVAIRGQQIIVPRPYRTDSSQDEMLYINPDGKFRLGPLDSSKVPQATDAKCPQLPEFGKTAYLTCVILHDLQDGRQRFIAYQSPCT